jgi:hypothetical protein
MDINDIANDTRLLQDVKYLISGQKYYILRSDKETWSLATYLCLTVTERYKFFWLGNDREYIKSIKCNDILWMVRVLI